MVEKNKNYEAFKKTLIRVYRYKDELNELVLLLSELEMDRLKFYSKYYNGLVSNHIKFFFSNKTVKEIESLSAVASIMKKEFGSVLNGHINLEEIDKFITEQKEK